MKIRVSNEPQGRNKNIIHVSEHFHQAIAGYTTAVEWETLFDQFRLNLQSRIVGADNRELLKLQASLEYSVEIEKFIKELLSPSVSG